MSPYSVRDAARILKVSPARLRYWKRTHLVPPRGDEQGEAPGEARFDFDFDFADLVCVRALLALIDHGVPLQRIRQSVEILREHVPELEEPLRALRVWSEAPRRVVVRHEGRLLEPDGQLVLEFAGPEPGAVSGVESLRRAHDAEDAVRVTRESARELGAIDWFEIGCGLDSDTATGAQAIAAYRNAIALDPDFADAHCNLGAALYNKGERDEARRCFEHCLGLDAGHVEAHFNLANLLEEEGRDVEALPHYERALAGDPLYGDLHVSLALLHERLQQPRRALDHWRRYLQIEPNGPLAQAARQRVEAAGAKPPGPQAR